MPADSPQTSYYRLIEGESGTGKELVARQIHEFSRRRGGPFVAVNCAAIVETLLEAELFGIEDRTATGVRGRRGKFEYADGGTLFLDEISDLSLSAQAKLLRAIQDLAVERVGTTGTRRVNIRIVAATNRPLHEMVASGQFRTDLDYRLSGVEVHVPPLRSRREDIEELAGYFLARHRQTRQLVLSDAARDALSLYAFPGNVRELERLIERAVALAESNQIEVEDLPPKVGGKYAQVLGPSVSAGDSMREWGSRYARLVFERSGRNKRRACRILDISYHTLRPTCATIGRRPPRRPSRPPAGSARSASEPSRGRCPSRRSGRLQRPRPPQDQDLSHPMHGNGIGARADGIARRDPLLALGIVDSHLDQFVGDQHPIDFGDKAVAGAGLADTDDGLQRMGASFEVGAFARRQRNRHKLNCATEGLIVPSIFTRCRESSASRSRRPLRWRCAFRPRSGRLHIRQSASTTWSVEQRSSSLATSSMFVPSC